VSSVSDARSTVGTGVLMLTAPDWPVAPSLPFGPTAADSVAV
jgi:hypothetical protein